MNALALASLDTFRNQVMHCDADTLLRSLPANSVHCMVTSPPYYGLRDYGTAQWSGGDPACQHVTGNQVEDHKAPGAITAGVRPGADNRHCRKCGAVRVDGQVGLEDTPDAYVSRLVALFELARRALRVDGVFWLNLGDSYAADVGGKCDIGREQWSKKQRRKNHTYAVQANRNGKSGLPAKNLIGIPWRVALALQAAGWWLRSEITWCKVAPMPESVQDRPANATEKVFMFTKNPRYYYDADAVRVPSSGVSGGGFSKSYASNQPAHGAMKMERPTDNGTRNLWNYWLIAPEPNSLPHFAAFPTKLVEPMILATCPAQVCPTCGAGYTRVTEREPMVIRRTARAAEMGEFGRTCSSGTMLKPATSTTVGFRPSCSCPQDAPAGRGITLDMFMGSGTTALVAQKHGRDYIGCDLNEDYVKLARERLAYHGDDARLVREQAAGVKQMGLFA